MFATFRVNTIKLLTLRTASQQKRNLSSLDYKKVKIGTVALNNGYDIPIVGLGTLQSSPVDVKFAVMDAIDLGYRHFECASAFGNEKEVGGSVNAKIGQNIVTRHDVFLSSKLWPTHHQPDHVVPSLKKTLTDLGTKYLDLYLVHLPTSKEVSGKPFYPNVDYVDTWRAMEETVKQGLVASIGLSNFNLQQIDRVLQKAAIQPSVLQIEYHPYLMNKEIVKFCQQNAITVTAYSPLGSPTRPQANPNEPILLHDPVLTKLARKYSKTNAQVILRWTTQQGIVVIPKAISKLHLYQNANIFDFKLSSEDIKLLDSLNRVRHFPLAYLDSSQRQPFKGL